MVDDVARLRQDENAFVLRIVQPALVGLIDGTISTLAPIFAAAFLAGSRAALLVGLATAIGAGISMGLSEGLSDDGLVTGRGSSLPRGAITGLATAIGGTFHTLPFLIHDVHRAVLVACGVVAVELFTIAWVRKRFLNVSLRISLVQVTLGGALVVGVGFVIGNS
ncbi:MAG TPA: VIT1/CCC1 transporter family protein [Gaiellales bacterium]|nr:VIT1/CCC1 transporter family protein [Gaiellales bacterium]